eukprot:gene4679-5728_t
MSEASTMLGDKSVLYSNLLFERLDATLEYARFAARAIVASAIFDLIDDNAGGTISKDVPYTVDSKPPEDQKKVPFIMEIFLHCARARLDEDEDEDDDEENQSKKRRQTGGGLCGLKMMRGTNCDAINRQDWVNMFT